MVNKLNDEYLIKIDEPRIQETCDEQWEIDMEEGYRYRPNALLKQDPGYDGLLK